MERAYLFTDPFYDRGSTRYGRPGIIAEFADRLDDRLLSLNSMHEKYLAPEADLSPLVAALRAATTEQVEAARHLMIHALERLGGAIFSRKVTIKTSHKTVAHDGAYAAYFRPIVERSERDVPPSGSNDVLAAATPEDFLVAVAGEVMGVSKIAFERLRRAPMDGRKQAAVAESAHALAEASLILGAAAHEIPTLGPLAAEVARADAEFGARVEAFRDDVGGEYAADVRRAVPSRSDVLARASTGAVRVGDVRPVTKDALDGLVERLGGPSDHDLARWCFNRRASRPVGTQSMWNPEPKPLTDDEAGRLKLAVAQAFEDYQAANHAPGFAGYLNQALFASASGYRPDLRRACVIGMEARDVLRRAAASLAGVTPPDRDPRITFRPVDASHDVLVGRFDTPEADDPVVVLYRTDPRTRVKGAAYLAVVPPEALDQGPPDIEDLDVRGLWYGTNLYHPTQAFEALRSVTGAAGLQLRSASVGYSSEIDVAPAPAMRA